MLLMYSSGYGRLYHFANVDNNEGIEHMHSLLKPEM